MKLAYAAYMPLTGDFLGLAPGLFMEDNIVSAEDLLDDYGIKSVAFNTDKKDTVCHIIGHKQIYANINYDTFDNTNGGANNATFGVYKNVSGSGLERGFSWDDSSGLRSDDYNNSVFTSSGRYSEAFWKALNSDGANNTDCMIKTNTNTNGGNNNGTLGILEGTGKHGTIGYFSDDFQSGLRTDVSMDSTGMSCVGSSEAFWNTLNSNGANNTDCMIKTNTNTNGGNNNGALGIFEGTAKCRSTGVIYGSNQSSLRTDVSMDSTGMSCVGSSEAFWNTLNSDGTNNTDCMIKTNTNTNGGNNGYLGILEGTGRCKPIGVFSGSNQSGLRTDDFVGTVGSNCTGNSEIFGNTLNSDDANNTDCMIKTNTNTNGGNDNDRYLGVLEGIDRNESIGVYTDNDSSRLRTDDFVGNVYFDSRKNSGTFQNTLNSDNTDCMRILVVVDIRGSSTLKDWFTDIGTEIGLSDFSFKAGMETVLKSLYHGTGETYVLLYRCGHSIIKPYTVAEFTTPFQT